MPELTVTIRNVKFQKPSGNGFWMILETDCGECKGTMSFIPQPGLRFKLTGNIDAFQGRKEFKFARAVPDVPVESRQRLHYLCEIATGVGPALEELIWDTCGNDWSDAERLAGVKMSERQRIAIREASSILAQNQMQVDAVAFLMGHGATFNMAQAAWDKWTEKTLSVVVANCYTLATLKNYGFIHVDIRVRHSFDISDRDPRRIQAAIWYGIQQLRDRGCTAIAWYEVLNKAKAITGLEGETLATEAKAMMKAGFITGWKETMMIATKEDFEHESAIWSLIG